MPKERILKPREKTSWFWKIKAYILKKNWELKKKMLLRSVALSLDYLYSKTSTCQTRKHVHKVPSWSQAWGRILDVKKLLVGIKNLKGVTIKPNTISPKIYFHVEQSDENLLMSDKNVEFIISEYNAWLLPTALWFIKSWSCPKFSLFLLFTRVSLVNYLWVNVELTLT